MAIRPTSDVEIFKSAANRTTIGEEVLAKTTVIIVPIITAWSWESVTSYIKEVIAIAKNVHIRQLLPEIMLTGRRLRIR